MYLRVLVLVSAVYACHTSSIQYRHKQIVDKHVKTPPEAESQANETWLYATAEVNPNIEIPSSVVTGIVHFRQLVVDGLGGPTEYMVSMTGFNSTDDLLRHGTHIHTYGTIRAGCAGSEGHYNPTDSRHGLPDDIFRHIGDLINLEEDGNGSVTQQTANDLISLMGEYSIMGRTWDVHEHEDTGVGVGGSQGMAGPRLACGVVAASDGDAWTRHPQSP